MKTNLTTSLNQSPYYFFFLVVDDSLGISPPSLEYFTTINSKEYDHEINSGQLLSNPKVVKFIENTAKTQNKLPAIVSFKPSAKIDFICKKNHWLNVGNSHRLTRLVEDKLKFPLICKSLKIPILPFVIDKFNKLSHQKALKQFGSQIIIQTHFGWAGKSTYRGDTFGNLKTTIPLNTPVKFSPYIGNSYTLLNNCCLTNRGLIQSPPAIQFTGIKELTKNPFSTVGRQWPSMAPEKIIKQVSEITKTFSKYLQKHNYKGFFGLDFLVADNNQVYILECNPRLTASFAFYTKIELKAKLEPLFFFHLAEFTLNNYPLDLKKEQSRITNRQIIGTQLTKRDDKNKISGKLETLTSVINSPNSLTLGNEIIRQVR